MDQLHGTLSSYGTTHDNFLLFGDFIIPLDDKRLKEFCNSFSLDHLVKTPTCYKGSNRSSIDQIITNMTSLFMKSCNVKTGLSDYPKLMRSIWRTAFAKGKNKNLFYRCYKNFDSKLFEETLVNKLSEMELSLKSFETTFSLTLKKTGTFIAKIYQI